MPLPKTIALPDIPRFMAVADPVRRELYIVCTSPLALIWVRQTIPAQLWVVEGPNDEQMLRDAADWYRNHAASMMDKN